MTKDIGTLSISKRLISQETLFVPEEVMRDFDEGRDMIQYRGLRGAGEPLCIKNTLAERLCFLY